MKPWSLFVSVCILNSCCLINPNVHFLARPRLQVGTSKSRASRFLHLSCQVTSDRQTNKRTLVGENAPRPAFSDELWHAYILYFQSSTETSGFTRMQNENSPRGSKSVCVNKRTLMCACVTVCLRV